MPDRDGPESPGRPAAAWHALEVNDVAARLETGHAGLPDDEVTARLGRHGPNRLEEAPPTPWWVLLLHQFASPLIFILVIAAAITLLLEEFVDAAVIAAVLALNATIGFTQESRAEASVRSLMQLVSPHARVIRGGRERDIQSAELVPGDLVLLESGMRVPADVRLLATTALEIDESLLTGESMPVRKSHERLPEETAASDRKNIAYAGCVVTSGRGRGYVVATGMDTELGSIARHVREQETPDTPLQRRMTRLAHLIGVFVGASAIAAFGLGVSLGEPASDMFLVAVAMAVAAVPEGLPVAFTIVLALGVRRMARRNAIIRRLPAVETLGSTTVVGSDKTGTLTENRMTVRQIWAGGRWFTFARDGREGAVGLVREDAGMLLGEHHSLFMTVLTGIMTNEAAIAPGDEEGEYETQGDPTEAALLVAAARLDCDPDDARADHPGVAEIPFESERQYSAAVRMRDGRQVLFVKGAPERVLAMSAQALFDDGPVTLDREAIHQAAGDMAASGLRVLAFAYRELDEPVESPHDVAEPSDLIFLGLQGMLDPPREGVKDAIAGCRRSGMRVLMITGDHARTALAIGRELGIADEGDEPVTGAELENVEDAELAGIVRKVSIFARVSPEQKLRVVNALHENGEVVAVTGDGVNDAPALRAADIGIAMGWSGTDVAREAADMVLADDNFVSIYAAVEEGRITFDNIRKVTFFLVSTGPAAILTILAAIAFGWDSPFLPAQLLWLNLVTNGLQDVALVFEPGEKDVLERPPRPKREGVISTVLWERVLLTAIVMSIGTLALFQWEMKQTDDLMRSQTVALTTLVLFQMFHVGNARSEFISVTRLNPFSNRFLFIATAAALAVHVAALYWEPTQYVLRVEPIGLDAWARIVAVAFSIVVVVEAHKLLRRGKRPSAGHTAVRLRTA